jgi:hypothetical protein
MVVINVFPRENYMETDSDVIYRKFGEIKVIEPLSKLDNIIPHRLYFTMYYTTSLTEALTKFNNSDSIKIYVFSENESLNIPQEIKYRLLEIEGAGLVKSKIKIERKLNLNVDNLRIRNLEFTYNQETPDSYFERYSYSMIDVSCQYFKLSKCNFSSDTQEFNNNKVSVIHLNRKYSENIKIHKNTFNNCILSLEFAIWLSIKNNIFNNCKIDSRLSNAFIERNKFTENTNLFFFNQYKSTIYNNIFENVKNEIMSNLSLKNTYSIIYADHNSNISILNNKFMISNNNKLLAVDRGSKVMFDYNTVSTNNLAIVDFNGKLKIGRNTFIENSINCYKGFAFIQTISMNEKSYDIYNNEVMFNIIEKE